MSYFTQTVFATSRRLILEQEGATATEYAVMLGVIIAVVVAAVTIFGSQVSTTTSSVYSGLSNGADSSGGSFGPGGFRAQTSVSLP